MSNTFSLYGYRSRHFNTDALDSGAFSLDDNIATTAGYTLAAGGLLATAVGTMVTPVPTLGLMTLGGGIVVTTKYKEIKQHFSASSVPPVAPDTHTDYDVTEGGKFATSAVATTVPVQPWKLS